MAGEGTNPRHKWNVAVRALCYLATAAPFVVATVRTLRRGWVPLGDTAAITARSWDVFSQHGPLLGQRTGIKGTYDLGPLQEWLLAIPTHVDPLHGVLWGGAVLAVVAAWLAIEAAWRAYGMAGAVLAAAVTVACVAWYPATALDAAWNFHEGIAFNLATIATTAAVLRGHRAWLPVLVVVASVAIQCHLAFAFSSVLLVGWAGWRAVREARRAGESLRVLAVAVAVGCACWAATVVQQFADRPGNLTALLTVPRGNSLGILFGLRAVTTGVFPPLSIWHGLDLPGNSAAVLIAERPLWLVPVAVLLVAGPVVVAWRKSLTGPLVVAQLSGLVSLGLLAGFAGVPRDGEVAVDWIMAALFPVFALVWISIGYTGWAWRSAAAAAAAAEGPSRSRLAALGVSLSLALMAAGTGASLAAVDAGSSSAFAWQLTAVVNRSASDIEHGLPRGPVHIELAGNLNNQQGYSVTEGVALQLEEDGYHPEVAGYPELAQLGSWYGPTAHAQVAQLKVTAGTATASVSVHFLRTNTSATLNP